MRPDPCVWVFHGNTGRVASGVFTSLEKAEAWIKEHGLSGTLSAFPLDEGVYDWAVRENAITMKPEKLVQKLDDPNFIIDCCPASRDHYHYEDGNRPSLVNPRLSASICG